MRESVHLAGLERGPLCACVICCELRSLIVEAMATDAGTFPG